MICSSVDLFFVKLWLDRLNLNLIMFNSVVFVIQSGFYILCSTLRSCAALKCGHLDGNVLVWKLFCL